MTFSILVLINEAEIIVIKANIDLEHYVTQKASVDYPSNSEPAVILICVFVALS